MAALSIACFHNTAGHGGFIFFVFSELPLCPSLLKGSLGLACCVAEGRKSQKQVVQLCSCAFFCL